MMNGTRMVASLALVMAACGGKTQGSGSEPSVAEARQETRGSGSATAKSEHEAACEHHKDADPAMAEAKALLEEKKFADAAAKFEAIAAAEPDNGKAVHLHGYALHAAGRLDEALAVHERAASFPDNRATALYNIACVHALKGDGDKAFAALEQSIKAGFGGADHMEKDEDLASLRRDPRFASMVQSARANPQMDKSKKHTCNHAKK